MHAVRDERVDEIIISTFPGERSVGCDIDLIGRVRSETGLPVEHVVTEPGRRGLAVCGMTAHAADLHVRATGAAAHQSSRVSADLGMLLLAPRASEVMLFGAFFTVSSSCGSSIRT